MKVMTVGAGGYGAGYVQTLLKDPQVCFEGIVEPYPERCLLIEQIRQAGIPVYATMEEFYARHEADLVVISTPPFLHREQSSCAMEHGSFVLCEKPAAPTVDAVEDMIRVEKQFGRYIGIGYQWSFSEAIQKLKRDVLDGILGKPLRLRTIVSWPRNRAYYARGGGWGGRIAKDGITIYDSIASNACAHYLHNMLFLLGDEMGKSVLPDQIEAECLRANAIENFDTCVFRMRVEQTELYFIASHAAKETRDPEFIYEFEKGCVKYAARESQDIIAIFHDGTVVNYGNPFANDMKKLYDCMAYAAGGSAPACTAETALAHTKLIGLIQNHVSITNFPARLLRDDPEENQIYVEGLSEALDKAYDGGSFLHQVAPEFESQSSSFSC